MANNFSKCVTFVLQAEGGWANNPLDPGGCTMCGITLPAFQEWLHNPLLTCADLSKVSSDEINTFYHEVYWQQTEAELLPLGVDLMVMDAAVNMGVSRSVKLLQETVSVTQDGVMGPVTLAAVLQFETSLLINLLSLAHLQFYRSLDHYGVFGTGWINRVHARRDASLTMLSMV